MELRVPAVPQMRIRDVGYADYVSVILSIRISTILSTSFPYSRVKDQCVSRQFKVIVRLERCCDRWYLSHEEVFQIGVRDVTGRDKQELERSVEQQKRVNKIRIFGYYHPRVTGGKFIDLSVGSTITGGQVERVEHIMACIAQSVCQPPGKLRVNQEVHARVGWVRLIWLNRAA
jgi:hypothetical protein